MPVMYPRSGADESGTTGKGTTGDAGTAGTAVDETLTGWNRIILHFIAPIGMVLGVVMMVFVQAYNVRSDGQDEYALPTAQIVAPTGTAAVPTATPIKGDNTAQPHAVIQGDDLALLPTIEAVNCDTPATEGERSACNAQLSPAAAPVPQPAQSAYRPAVQPVLVSSQQQGSSEQAPAILQSFAPMSASQSDECNADGTQCSKSKPDRRP